MSDDLMAALEASLAKAIREASGHTSNPNDWPEAERDAPLDAGWIRPGKEPA